MEASVRFSSVERAVADILALGLEVEAISPAWVREAMTTRVAAAGVYLVDPSQQ